MAGPTYPHEIRPHGWSLYQHLLGCGLAVVLVVWLVWITVTGEAAEGEEWVIYLLTALWILIGAYAVGEASIVVTQRTTFEAHAVTVANMWTRRRLERADVTGWRDGMEWAGLRSIELENATHRWPFQVWIAKTRDPTVDAWFNDMPSLAHTELRAALQEVKQDASFGHTVADRLRTADSEARVVGALRFVALALMFWVFLYPRPYVIAIGAAIIYPLIVIALTVLRRDRWKLERPERDLRPSTGGVILLCALGLLARAMLDWSVIDWERLTLMALGAGLAGALAFRFLTEARVGDPTSLLLGWVPLGFIYAYGALAPINGLLDRAPAQIHRAPVMEVFSEDVRIGAAGPVRAGRYSASRRVLAQLTAGDEVCVRVNAGALAVRTFVLRACD